MQEETGTTILNIGSVGCGVLALLMIITLVLVSKKEKVDQPGGVHEDEDVSDLGNFWVGVR